MILQTATLVSGWLALMGLWALFYWGYRDYRVDALRQRIFALRDGFFDYAAGGHIAFTHPSYRALRNHLNGLLRFADRLGFAWVLTAAIMRIVRPAADLDRRFIREHEQIFTNAPAPARPHLERVHEAAMLFALEHIVLTSMLVWMLVVPVIAVLVVRTMWREWAPRIARYIPGRQLIDREATELGMAV